MDVPVDDYNCMRHSPGHRLIESTWERALEMGVWFLSETEMERSDSLLLIESWEEHQMILLRNALRKDICWVRRAYGWAQGERVNAHRVGCIVMRQRWRRCISLLWAESWDDELQMTLLCNVVGKNCWVGRACRWAHVNVILVAEH